MAGQTTAVDKSVPFREAALLDERESSETVAKRFGDNRRRSSWWPWRQVFLGPTTSSPFPSPCDGGKPCLPKQRTCHSHLPWHRREMHIQVNFLPPNTDFDVFVIQQPNAPFGLAFYEGDILTDSSGSGVTDLIGRFQFGTFIVGVGTPPAPVTQPKGPFPDASTNPATNPVQLYHVGIWFELAAGVAQSSVAPRPCNQPRSTASTRAASRSSIAQAPRKPNWTAGAASAVKSYCFR